MDLRAPAIATLVLCLVGLRPAIASDLDEFKVKRQSVFAFSQRPRVTRLGDRVTVAFASKAFCDATVAVENADGKMVRHLASGVLGENAPPPFQKSSLKQVIVWDGKDDRGKYVDDKERMVVRVSLGLRPRYERALFWSPYKRYGAVPPLICPAPEGVYVFDSRGKNTLRLYDHTGRYVRTVHPAPADKIADLKGIEWIAPPQTRTKAPVLRGFCQTRFLTCSEGVFNYDTTHHGDPVYQATSFAVGPSMGSRPARIALAYLYLNRLATDGSTGGLPIEGPMVGRKDIRNVHWHQDYGKVTVGPTSLVFSPDGKTLYMTGYLWNVYSNKGVTEAIFHGVQVMDFESNDPPKIFAGKMTLTDDGADNAHFAGPTSVACDAKGRVYVSDYLNNRVQVFSPGGKHLKTLLVKNPSKVMVSHKDGTIIASSWPINCFSHRLQTKYGLKQPGKREAGRMTWTSLGTFDRPRPAAPQLLPLQLDALHRFHMGQPIEVSWDPWADEPTVWIAGRKQALREYVVMHHGKMAWEDSAASQWQQSGLAMYALRDGKWEMTRDFDKLTRRTICRHRPAAFHGQRLAVAPRTGMLYLLEYRGHLGMKSNPELLRIDPASGRIDPIVLPISTEDICFDLEGSAYLRDDRAVVRYDPTTWREIPWDYGEQRKSVGMGDKKAAAIGALMTPGRMPATGHQEGMFVDAFGRLALSCFNLDRKIKFTYGQSYSAGDDYKPYKPRLYPGRVRYQEIHIFDRHGKVLFDDAVPGLAHVSGLAMDEDGYLYVLAAGARAYDGKSPFNAWSGALIKFMPKKGRVVASRQKKSKHDGPDVALAPEDTPKRPHDLENGVYDKAWVDGAEWFYGGVGFFGQSQGGFGRKSGGYTWDDWASRFGFDRYARSFVHELDNYSIAVVDKNGNLILRFGKHGNEQDGVPLMKNGGAPDSRPLGGSEVALMRPTVMAVHSDRRLFVADAGNSRIVSVKLGYHATEKVALKDVAEKK